MNDELRRALDNERYSRSSGYDPAWVIANEMGPHPLWLMEALTGVVTVEPSMRVLDLGCGRALTSIFLAREFGVEVWAADLWIDPADNLARVAETGLVDRVHPIRVEAHELPFHDDFFDLVLSVDAFHYFGTEDFYLDMLLRVVRDGGRVGMVSPGLTYEIGQEVPDHLAPFWEWEYETFHSPAWWRRHWERSGMVEVETADLVVEGWRDWLRWSEVAAPHAREEWMRVEGLKVAGLLRIDAGRTVGFTRVVARKLPPGQ